MCLRIAIPEVHYAARIAIDSAGARSVHRPASVHVPHDFWGIADGGSAACCISAFVGAYQHRDGKKRLSYVVTEVASGEHFAIAANYLASVITPLTLRAKLRKKTGPRPLKQM